MHWGIICSLLVTALQPAEPPKDEPAKKIPAELQGTWKLESLEISGEPFPGLDRLQPKWIIKGDKILYGGEEFGLLSADATTSPRLFDLALGKAKTSYEGIYAVEKDTLKICLNGRTGGVKERPADFSTKDKENLRLLVFQREKPKDGAEPGGIGFVGLQLKGDKDRGEVIVQEALKGSPAMKAGLRKDDVLLKVSGTEVQDLLSAVNLVRQAKPGKELVLRIKREGKEQDVSVKVGLLPFEYLLQLD